MATPHGRNSVIKIDNEAGAITDITSYVQSVTFPPSSEAAEATAMGMKGVGRLAGIDDATIDFEGLADPVLLQILCAALSFRKTIQYYPEGTGSGKTYFYGEAIVNSVELEMSLDSAVTFSASAEFDGGYTRATV